MSDNVYLDTYIGRVYDVSDPNHPECVEMATVRAVDFSHAEALVRDNLDPDTRLGTISVDVKRWRHRRCVATPSDIERNRRKRRRSKAPQYGVS